MIQLTDSEFRRLVAFVRGNFGIDLSKKRLLIEARMYAVLARKKVSSFSQYFEMVRGDRNELNAMMNRLTTNHTYFMREPRHFEFLKDVILPAQEKTNRSRSLHVWSAGCSTGEEAYTAVMVMKEYFALCPGWDYRTLATDLSTRALQSAARGVYPEESLAGLPPQWRHRYFRRQSGGCALSDEIQREVIFRQLNLMEPFPFHTPFDLIFCRNVMIYFSQEARDSLVARFRDALKPGGYLFIGHSETIPHNATGLRYIEPSIYQKGP
jgi:chemotaxis protein methyltransferase CheR